MKYLIIRNEQSIDEVIDKAYKSLPKNARLRAREALLKENPVLADFTALKRGSIIRVPEIFPKSKNNIKNLVDPIETVSRKLTGNIKQFERRLSDTYKILEQSPPKTQEVLKAAASQIRKDPNATKTAALLRAHLKGVNAINAKRRDEQLKALNGIRKTVASFGRK